MKRAVVDVGSNSVLLVAAERIGDKWNSILETSTVTGLGRDTKTTKLLSEQGMTETLKAIKTAYEVACATGCTQIIARATMAARIATNTEQFLERGEAQGTPIEVLTGDREAELGFLAVASDSLVSNCSRISIVDVGGQSTELVTATRVGMEWETNFRCSYPVGTLGLRETILTEPSPNFQQVLAAVSAIDDVIGHRYLPHQCGQVIALGAAGTNLVTIRDRMTAWDSDIVHGSELTYEEISKMVGGLCDLDDVGRANLVGIEPGREFTIHIGALILERFLFALGAESCLVSTKGWRHALLTETP